MILTTALPLSLLLACGGDKGATHTGEPSETGSPDTHEPEETGHSGETGETGETGDTAIASLHGSPPEESIPLPDFSATNRDGTGRGPEDLVGSPTVMWFYPAAATGG